MLLTFIQFSYHFPQQESSGNYAIKVWSFQQMNNVLKAAGEKKIKEVQMCLEGAHPQYFSSHAPNEQL